jgi:UDP-N-acetylmuramyl pentapeptide phosphotransferase/UDP-N-acetylglucosamine-1-phosphate transferase
MAAILNVPILALATSDGSKAALAMVVAAAVANVAAGLARRAGPGLGLVDRPDGVLKTHEIPVVPLGGVGVAAGVIAGAIVAGVLRPSTAVAIAIAFVVGLVDDRVSLDPKIRLVAELAAGVALVSGPFQEGAIGWLAASVGVAATVVSINAVNLFDGLDGLVSASALAGLVGAAVLLVVWDGRFAWAAAGIGALAGFLPRNWNPASMFLGDNGSYTVGTVLAACVVEAAAAGRGVGGMLAASSIATVFGLDLAVTLYRRRKAGVPLFAGDRSHVYDRLHAGGWSVKRVATVSALVNGVAALIVATAALAGTWIAAVTALVLFGLGLATIGRSGVVRS